MLLFCFQYDPSTARYSATILGIMRVLALMTIAGLLLMIVIYRQRDKRAPDGFEATKERTGSCIANAIVSEQASNFAPQVDNLVLFMIAVVLFFAWRFARSDLLLF